MQQRAEIAKRRFYTDGKKVLVFDNVVSRKEIISTSNSLKAARYTSYQISEDNTGNRELYYNLYQAKLDAHNFSSTELYRASRYLAYLYKRERPASLTQVFCNAFRYGESVFPHTDHPRVYSGVTSVLYCVNDSWEPDWGGELFLFDTKGEVSGVVGFKPGRFIVFDGSILHRPGVPTRNCPHYRFALNIRFEW